MIAYLENIKYKFTNYDKNVWNKTVQSVVLDEEITSEEKTFLNSVAKEETFSYTDAET